MGKAEADAKLLKGGEPAIDVLLDSLSRMRWPLYNSNEWETVQRLSELQMRFEPRDTDRYHSAGVFHATMFYKLGQYTAAIKELDDLSQDLSRVRDHRIKSEIQWVKALSYIKLEQFADSITALQGVLADPRFGHRGDARVLLVMALVNSERIGEAAAEYSAFEKAGDKSVLSMQALAILRAGIRASENRAAQ